MGTVRKKEVPAWAKAGHARPVTRRDFLAHGLIPFAASALVPGALGLLGASAGATEVGCPTPAGALAPFITLNLNGGAALCANFIPTDLHGNKLPSYSKMGNGDSPAMDSEFGAAAFSASSQVIAGIRSVATAPTLAKTAFIGLCVHSADDSGANAFDASGLVYKAGLVGGRLPNLGINPTTTGLRQLAATIAPPPPLIVNSFTDLTGSIGYTNALKNSLSSAQSLSLTKLVQSLSASQTRKLASVSTAAGVKTLVDCAGLKNVTLVQQGAGAIDPLVNAPAVASLWGISAGSAATDQGRVFGSMVYNALAGNAGSVNLEMTGFDYHDNTRATGDAKDKAAGTVIGQILESARVMNTKVFVYVTSDGCVVSTDSSSGGTSWVSDRGQAGTALVFAFDPVGRPATSAHQIGGFTAGQVADESHVVGANPEIAAQAAFANYLQFNKRPDLFTTIVPRGTLVLATLAEVIKIV